MFGFGRVDRLSRKLLGQLGHDRDVAGRELAELGTPNAVRALIAVAHSCDSVAASVACTALASVRNPRAFQDLLNATKDDLIYVRIHAIKALGSFPNPAGTKRLLELLGEKNFGLQHTAAEALGRLREERALPRLTEILRTAQAEASSYDIDVIKKVVEQIHPGSSAKIMSDTAPTLEELIASRQNAAPDKKKDFAHAILQHEFSRVRELLGTEDLARVCLDAEVMPPRGHEDVSALFSRIATDYDIAMLVGCRGATGVPPIMVAIGPRCIPFLLPTLRWTPSLTARIDALLDRGALSVLAEIGDKTCIAPIEELGRQSAYVKDDCARAIVKITERTGGS